VSNISGTSPDVVNAEITPAVVNTGSTILTCLGYRESPIGKILSTLGVVKIVEYLPQIHAFDDKLDAACE
jgi:hypothetical protein